MNKQHDLWRLPVLGGLLLLGAALVSCAPDTSAPERQAKVASLGTSAEQTDSAQPASANDAASVPAVAFTDTACLDCHTNQERLVELAVEEEETESLSSGPG